MKNENEQTSLGKTLAIGVVLGVVVGVASYFGIKLIGVDVSPAIVGGITGGVTGAIVPALLAKK